MHTSAQGRKITLQALTSNTPRSTAANSQANSPLDLFLNQNNKRKLKKNVSFSSQTHSSPNVIISPRNGFPPPGPPSSSQSQSAASNYSSKAKSNTATLFDYIVTPIKSPGQQDQFKNETPVVINDFKNRFQQHSKSFNKSKSFNHSNLTMSNPNSVNTTPVNHTNSNIIINSANIQSQQLQKQQQQKLEQLNEIELLEKQLSEQKLETKKVDYTNLVTSIKNTLSESDLERASLLAKLYTQLILNNFIVTINIELFFLFQLLTLNSIEDKNELQILGKLI